MITKAVIPAAGLGTRFLPATKSQPKEMLPIIDVPTIQYVVQEAVDSGITDILIITGKGKRSIEDHFDRNTELEARLAEKEDTYWYNEMRRLADMANIHFIRQKETNGLGDAILYARHHVGQEAFAVLLGDTIFSTAVQPGSVPVTKQLIEVYNQYNGSVVAVENVDPSKAFQYGIVGGSPLTDTIMRLDQLVEKPAQGQQPSNKAIAGRYVLSPGIFDVLDNTPFGKNNELQLTDALVGLLKSENIYSYTTDAIRYDIGNKLDYLKTSIAFGLQREEFKDELLAFIKTLI